jgi:nitronate monooxygenase
MQGGDIDGGIWSAGQSQGLIHDIPTCEVLVKRIMKQAEDIIHTRLERMSPDRATATA